MNPNHPKQQHSVPQMLLRNFCDDSGRLWVSNGSKTWKSKPKNVFVEKDLYTNFRYERSPDTQDLEEFVRSTPRTYEYEEHLGRIESEATPAIRRIITQARRGRCPEFTPEARYACLRFLLAQFRRTPESQRRTAGEKNFDEIFYEENAVIAQQHGVPFPDMVSFYGDPRVKHLEISLKGTSTRGLRQAYGYRRGERGKPEIDESEAEVVKRIFRQCVQEGMGAYRIAHELMDDGIPTKHLGTRWNLSTVSRMLSNPTYKGTWWYGKQRHTLTENGRRIQKQPEDSWIPIPVPQLVDEATWQKAQEAKIQRTNRAKRNTKLVYMLQHLVRCTECGMLFGGHATRHRTIRRNGKVYQYELDPPRRRYRCYGISKGLYGCREHPMIRAEKLEGFIWDEVKRVVQSPELIVSGIKSATGPEGGPLKEQIDHMERDLVEVQGEEDRAIWLHVSGKISATQLDRQRKFIAEKSEILKAKLEEYRNLEEART